MKKEKVRKPFTAEQYSEIAKILAVKAEDTANIEVDRANARFTALSEQNRRLCEVNSILRKEVLELRSKNAQLKYDFEFCKCEEKANKKQPEYKTISLEEFLKYFNSSEKDPSGLGPKVTCVHIL